MAFCAGTGVPSGLGVGGAEEAVVCGAAVGDAPGWTLVFGVEFDGALIAVCGGAAAVEGVVAAPGGTLRLQNCIASTRSGWINSGFGLGNFLKRTANSRPTHSLTALDGFSCSFVACSLSYFSVFGVETRPDAGGHTWI